MFQISLPHSLETVIFDTSNIEQLKKFKSRVLKESDGKGQYSVAEAIACIDEGAVQVLEKILQDKTVPGQSPLRGILTGLTRTTMWEKCS